MGFPPCRSRKRPSPPEGRGPDFGPLRALHLKHTFLPACHRKVSTDMLVIGFSTCLSKKRPSQGPNGQALRNLAEKNRPRWPHFRLGLLAGSPSRKPNRTARKAIKDEHKKEQPRRVGTISGVFVAAAVLSQPSVPTCHLPLQAPGDNTGSTPN